MVLGVADIDRPVGPDDGAVRTAEPRSGSWTLVASRSFAAAGDGFDNPVGSIDAPDCMVLGVDDQDVAAGVESEFLRRIENRVPRRAAVAAATAGAGAGPCV